ncbi:MAG: hypothetical protein FJX70_07835 [Alphaproteobacteria bacterium]|nr:hypothetical protein [Alphaproteobacteria bacterium]
MSKAVINKARAKTKNKANVVYINSYKKRNIVKSYTKTDDDWLDIPRADDPTKTLAENSARVCGKVIYELHKNFDRPVYLTSQWFKKITKKKIHQNTRIRKQLSHIFNFTFHHSIQVDGEILFNVYEVSYTAQAYNILNFKDEKNECNTPPIASANKLSSESKNAVRSEHKCSSYIDNKEKEEHPKGCNSSFSDNEKLKIKNSTEQENQHATFAPCSLTQLEQVAHKPEQQVEPNQSVTNCSQLTASQEKAIELDRKQRTSEDTGLFAMSDLMAQVLNEPQKTEEIPKMNLEELPQITDKQERAILLSRALWQAFGEERSGEIQDDYKFVEQDQQKVCIQTKEMRLNDIEKAKIRKCIQSVYGEDVTIAMQVLAPASKEPMPSNENVQLPTSKSNLLTFKSKLLIYNVQQTLSNPMVKVIEAPDKIIVDAVAFFIESLTYPGNIDDLERAVLETGLTLELHTRRVNHEFKNFDVKPIVLTPEKILKDREWLENHKKSLQEGNNGI